MQNSFQNLIDKIPLVLCLEYEPKDVVIAIGGLVYGPFTSFLAAAIVAALAIFTAAWYYGGLARSGPLTAAIVHRGQVVQTVELDRLTEEMTVTVEGDYHLTILLDRDGVRVAESDCPGQDCVHTGTITRAGQSIVCLPEQVVVQLTGGGGGPDAVLG